MIEVFRNASMIKKLVVHSIIIALTVVFAHAQGQRTRLTNDWKFFKGDLGGIWEAVRTAGEGAPESVPSWKDVTLPHCFNAEDAAMLYLFPLPAVLWRCYPRMQPVYIAGSGNALFPRKH